MSGSADAAPGNAQDPLAGHTPADAAASASGSPAEDGMQAAGEPSSPDPAGCTADEPSPDDEDEGGRYVPL